VVAEDEAVLPCWMITPKLDRMFRSARDALDVLERLKRQNVALHMIDLGGA
jgi:putative DNA-invertase from lambdoid prophage Rac